jgi:hypothetical protein
MLYVSYKRAGLSCRSRASAALIPVSATPTATAASATGIRWPFGFGGQTFKFTACLRRHSKGGHGFTECRHDHHRPELPRPWVDGRIDDAWAVSNPRSHPTTSASTFRRQVRVSRT